MEGEYVLRMEKGFLNKTTKEKQLDLKNEWFWVQQKNFWNFHLMKSAIGLVNKWKIGRSLFYIKWHMINILLKQETL